VRCAPLASPEVIGEAPRSAAGRMRPELQGCAVGEFGELAISGLGGPGERVRKRHEKKLAVRLLVWRERRR
jgi:hypothetical protein